MSTFVSRKFGSLTGLCVGLHYSTRRHVANSLRTRQVFTRICDMQRQTKLDTVSQYRRNLEKFLQAIPDKYPKSYQLTGFSWNDFNKIGGIHAHSQVGYIQLAAYQHIPPIDEDNSTSYFGRSLILRFLPAYHSTNFVSRPVRYDSYMAYLGRTSMYINIDLLDDESGMLYMSGQLHCMAIDIEKRKPVPISHETFQKYEDKIALKEAPQRHQFLPMQPAEGDVFRWSTVVQWSDVDYNGHVNQMPYLRFMYDAGSSAAVAGYLKSFHREFIHYRLKTYAVEYIKEIHQGQELDILCLEVEDNPGTIHFDLHVEDQIVSRSHLIFDVPPLTKL